MKLLRHCLSYLSVSWEQSAGRGRIITQPLAYVNVDPMAAAILELNLAACRRKTSEVSRDTFASVVTWII
jgi:hypothetical protein